MERVTADNIAGVDIGARRQRESRREAVVSTSHSPFGQNEWLVEEMYRKFREDPSSVDPSWHEFLVDYSPEPTTDTTVSGQAPSERAGANGQLITPPTPQPAPPPEPKPAPAAEQPAPAKAAAPAKSEPSPAKAEPAKPKSPAGPPPGDDDELAVLRGAAAAVVKNMNASLDVPTATSVRAIPAKLMIDNRVVINNHLKRTRGGKISFTHLLGTRSCRRSRRSPT